MIKEFYNKVINRVIRKSVNPSNQLSEVFRPPGQESAPPGFGKALHRLVDGKVAIITLPKSGTNWLYPLVASCLGIELAHPEDKWGNITSKAIGCHTQFEEMQCRQDLVFMVYMIRDLRDIIVSYYYYSQTKFYKNANPTCVFGRIDDFYFEYFLSTIVPTYDWYNHAEQYIVHGVPLIKYENLWDNPTHELTILFERWGISIADKNINNAIEKNRIDKARKTGIKTWREIPATHFRKGGYGNYPDHLPPHVLKDINKRFGDYLTRWGYSLD